MPTHSPSSPRWPPASATATYIARTRYNNYFPLLGLGRTEEALAVLRECRQVFQDARDTLMLGRTLSALADVEETRGRHQAILANNASGAIAPLDPELILRGVRSLPGL